jgi:hypothetical protein
MRIVPFFQARARLQGSSGANCGTCAERPGLVPVSLKHKGALLEVHCRKFNTWIVQYYFNQTSIISFQPGILDLNEIKMLPSQSSIST